jgi:hypothetical protein
MLNKLIMVGVAIAALSQIDLSAAWHCTPWMVGADTLNHLADFIGSVGK